ncbi:hypothetical protein FC56_GL000484 [Lentilactobacillus senioris DSM 24302 = JCM 17472]|uniref:Uncharacterized protein n=1 Tax=Lentilactobacillus senioris DSM 24302 = JCM 17472 TaxID=1423802 RepID=A0A0R2D0M7_9LACO|nr:hypothetical protein [Lentilactobacillus senioris]KRM93766.1 hypothetical protein FC56_GL000484 [Lentilactobacillus senioris DSM 24302 = JCM 17472]
MQLFKISFINKIKPDTVEINYVATLEGTQSAPIFEGRQLFYRDNIDSQHLKNGAVAIKAIINILSVTSPDLILDRVLLNQSQDKNILNSMSKQDFDKALTARHLLNRLKTHLDDNQQPVIDTEIITEMRIG